MAKNARTSDAGRLEALIRAGIHISAERGLDAVLQTIADTARELIGARYAAIGVLNASGQGLSQFVVSGLAPAQHEAIGKLPTGQGILGVVITDPRPLRLPDLTRHAKSTGFPPNHPPMHSFLGVPVPGRHGPMGNLYLTEKEGSETFSAEDERLAVLFAAQAGVAVENAGLNEEMQRLLNEVRTMQRSRDRFFATINHELRNALTAVYGWSELLMRKLGADAPRAAREVHESSERTLGLLNDMLDLSRLEADRLRPNLQEAKVAVIIDEAMRALEPAAAARDVTLDFAAVRDQVTCHTDPQRTRQIVINLLSNAVRHSPENAAVVVTLVAGTDAVQISVQDDGPGIPPELQEHVFEAFTRGTADDRGTGLGLTLSRQLARLMGGDLTVRSVLGQGATFALTLPRHGVVPLADS